MSRSLHSSTAYFAGSKRWSRNESDIDPWKSSIGEISSKISSKPDWDGSSPRSDSGEFAMRSRHSALPSNQSKLSRCRARRFGTSSGSEILAKEIRRGAVLFFDAAKLCPSKTINVQFKTHTTVRPPAAICHDLVEKCEGAGYRCLLSPV